MRITIVGCGSIGSKLAKAADEMAEVKRIYLMDEDHPRAENLAAILNKAIVINDVEEELYHTDLVIEAASQKAATVIVPKVVARGVDIMIMSVGALVDDEFREMVKEKAIQSEAKIFIPSGAVCGTDGLRSSAVGELEEVELITTKGPKSLEGVDWIEDHGIDVDTLTEPTTVFSGTARDAVKLLRAEGQGRVRPDDLPHVQRAVSRQPQDVLSRGDVCHLRTEEDRQERVDRHLIQNGASPPASSFFRHLVVTTI